MRTVLIVIGVFVGAIVAIGALAAVVGMFLPQAHVASRAIRVGQPPDRVFALISDFAQMPAWRADISRVELLPSEQGRTVYREHGSDAVTYRVEAIDPPRRLVVRIADTNLPYGGAWTYEVVPTADSGTTLTITERGEVYNPLFRFMSRFVFSHHATIDGYLRAVAAKFGEPATPQPATATPVQAEGGGP